MALTQVDAGLISPTNAQYTMFKNKLINGSMQVWQRGTSFSAPANGAYTADRWLASWGTANRTYSQQAGFSNFQYCLRVQRNNGTADTSWCGAAQIIESNNLYDLQGQTVTVSFYARCGANFSSANNNLTVTFGTGTTADQGWSTYWSPGWAGSANVFSQGVTLTTTAQRFSITGTFPSNALEALVNFQYLAAGTAGAADYFEITGVQIEKGSTATSFDYRPFTTELQLCQRYYEKTYPYSVVPGTSTGSGEIWSTASSFSDSNLGAKYWFKVTKRNTSWSYTAYQAGGTSGSWNYSRSGASGTGSVVMADAGTDSCLPYLGVGAAWTNAQINGHLVVDNEL